MTARTLTADVEIPYLGFGTYLIANDDPAAAVGEAIRAGYRHIDTAEGYQNETGVGEGIKHALASGGLTRGDLFVTTKRWPGNPARGQPAKYGVSEAQVLLRGASQKGYPVIPKSTNPERIRRNADIFGFAIDEEDMAVIGYMDRGDGKER